MKILYFWLFFVILSLVFSSFYIQKWSFWRPWSLLGSMGDPQSTQGGPPPPCGPLPVPKSEKKVSAKIKGPPFGAILSQLEANGSFGKGFFGSKFWSIFSMDFWPVFDLFLEVFSKVFQLVFYSFFFIHTFFFWFFFMSSTRYLPIGTKVALFRKTLNIIDFYMILWALPG